MTAYKGNNRRIKDALVTVLQGVTYDTGSGGEPAFVNVLDNTKDEFEGYPSVRLLPNDITSITGSSTQKDHTVSFAALMHFPLEDPANIESDVYNQMYDLTDLIVDTVEHGDYVGQLSAIDPAINNWKMEVSQATWQVVTGKIGSFLLCNVNINTTYSKDVY